MKKIYPPKKTDSKLSLRIRKCITRTNLTAKDFAAQIGVSSSAITKYLVRNSEPSITVASAIAKTAKVSLDWLATGEGSPDVGNAGDGGALAHLIERVGGIEVAANLLLTAAESAVNEAGSSPKVSQRTAPDTEASATVPEEIRARLGRFISEYGGLEIVAKDTRLSVGRLAALCHGEAPTMRELQCLVSNKVLSLDWLVAGDAVRDESAWSAQVLVRLEKSMRNFDAKRPPVSSFDGLGGVSVDPTPYIYVEGIADLWAKIYRVLPPSRYASQAIRDDSMDPVIREGDIVLFDMNQKEVTSGVCMIETSAGRVIARVQNRGGKLMASYLAHNSPDFEIDQNAIAGVAVWAFRKITLRDA